jgi:molecular chaperone Hsp33
MSSDTDTPLLDADARRRFLIESCDVRGDLVRLGQSRREATANTDYPPVIDRLLGEAFVSAVLLAGTIKFDGRMTFQVRGDGAIHLLVVQVAADASYRGLARWSHVPADDASLVECFGEDARLTITIEARAGVEPYQGIVPLEGDNLADAIAAYFRSSEQLPTELTLEVDSEAASGLLLQRVPAAADPESADEGWARATLLAGTLESRELSSVAPDTLLRRLYHQEDVRLLEAREPRFHCSCSRNRTDGMLTGLGQAEVESILEERGNVEIICEFCDAAYRYDAVDVGALFSSTSQQDASGELAQATGDTPTHH